MSPTSKCNGPEVENFARGRFDQSAKQLTVGHATKTNVRSYCSITPHARCRMPLTRGERTFRLLNLPSQFTGVAFQRNSKLLL